jgi:hypothetical protein
MADTLGQVLADVNKNIHAGRSVVTRSSLHVLRAQWPQLYVALVETFFDRARIGLTYIRPAGPGGVPAAVKCNDAGYLLRGAEAVLERAGDLYGQLEPTRAVLDPALAGETRYIHASGRRPLDSRPYLVRAWLNLLVERPERIWPSRYGRGKCLRSNVPARQMPGMS